MPVTVNTDLVSLTQRQFSDVAYEVMAEAFSVHNEFGSLFDEAVCRDALAARLPDIETEVQIKVTFGDFNKLYFVDAVIAGAEFLNLKRLKILCRVIEVSC